jgi:hypothetical protein
MNDLVMATKAPRKARPGRLLTLRALAVFVVLDAAFRLSGVGRILGALGRGRARGASQVSWPPEEGREQAERTFAAVQRATAFYYRRRRDCLPKAVTAFQLLRRQGLAAELCFGVKKFPFAAHSWVEAYGVRLDDDPSRIDALTVIHRISA